MVIIFRTAKPKLQLKLTAIDRKASRLLLCDGVKVKCLNNLCLIFDANSKLLEKLKETQNKSVLLVNKIKII